MSDRDLPKDMSQYFKKYYSVSQYSGLPHMMDVPVYIFDSETTSDPHHLCEELGLPEDSTMEEIRREFNALTNIQRKDLQNKLERIQNRLGWRTKEEQRQARKRARDRHKFGLPFSPWTLQAARIISVARLMLTVDTSDPFNHLIRDITFCGVETLAFDPDDESLTLSQVIDETNAVQPVVVGWNSRGYDIPVVINRSGIPTLGLKQPEYLMAITRTKRYGPMDKRNVDVMKEWAGGGTRFPGLDAAARAMGGAGKMGKSGSGVLEMWLQEDYGEIAAYCECDVLNTMYVYVVWLRSTGQLYDNAVYNRFVDQQVKYFNANAKDRPHLREYLRQWRSHSKNRLKLPRGKKR